MCTLSVAHSTTGQPKASLLIWEPSRVCFWAPFMGKECPLVVKAGEACHELRHHQSLCWTAFGNKAQNYKTEWRWIQCWSEGSTSRLPESTATPCHKWINPPAGTHAGCCPVLQGIHTTHCCQGVLRWWWPCCSSNEIWIWSSASLSARIVAAGTRKNPRLIFPGSIPLSNYCHCAAN